MPACFGPERRRRSLTRRSGIPPITRSAVETRDLAVYEALSTIGGGQ